MGPGDYDRMRHLPPGAQRCECVAAPSGHLMLQRVAPARRRKHTGDWCQLQQTLALPVEQMVQGGGLAKLLSQRTHSALRAMQHARRCGCVAHCGGVVNCNNEAD